VLSRPAGARSPAAVLRWPVPRRPRRCEHAAPGRGFRRLAVRLVQLHEAFEGFAKAIGSLRRDARFAFLHPAVAIEQQRLGLGEFALAEQHYLRAVEALEKTTGNETVEYASLYNNLGSLYYAAGFSDQAGEVFESALKLRQQLLGENHPDFAQSHSNMAAVQHELGNDAAAQKSFETALGILEQHLPEKAASYAATGEDYIGLLGSLGEDAKAAAFQKRLFQVLEQKAPGLA
jgi:tetratricopeptide (TPR) repeat protein